jgi:RNase H-fold protein (predicted Holliday junction resolvase)
VNRNGMLTGKHHFENIDIDEMKQISKEKKSREIVVGLKFGTSAPTIKIQLREQGFKLSNGLVKDAEMVRTHLLALKDIRILNDKQLMKCFKKLSRQISQRVVDSVIQEDETAIHIKTKEVN